MSLIHFEKMEIITLFEERGAATEKWKNEMRSASGMRIKIAGQASAVTGQSGHSPAT